MRMKSADDKTKRLALLEDLQKSTLLDARQKDWLHTELRNLKAGIKGEQAAAFYLDGHYKDRQNNVLLHDLRLVVDDEVAQIDHLVINRTGYMVLIETKNYSGDLEVNAHGEFTVRYGQDHYGVASPFEQSRRHARILADQLALPDFMQPKPATPAPVAAPVNATSVGVPAHADALLAKKLCSSGG
jgi:hypothetical protein